MYLSRSSISLLLHESDCEAKLRMNVNDKIIYIYMSINGDITGTPNASFNKALS